MRKIYLHKRFDSFKDSNKKTALEILSWLESLAADPELCLLKELILYFYLVYTNNSQSVEIKKVLKLSGYKKISDSLPK